MAKRLQEVQTEAAAAVPGGTSTMALLRKVRTLEAQLLDEQTRRAAATAAAAGAAAGQDSAAEVAALRGQLQAAQQARADLTAQLEQQAEKVGACALPASLCCDPCTMSPSACPRTGASPRPWHVPCTPLCTSPPGPLLYSPTVSSAASHEAVP